MKAPVLVLFAVMLAGCGGRQQEPAAAPPAPPPAAALPVTAPMQARERMLHDLGQHSQQARDRAGALDEVINRDR